MPLWLPSLRQRVCRWPLRPCFRSPSRQRQWQGRQYRPRSYNTALRESRQDETKSSTVPLSRDPFDDTRYLLGLTSPEDGAKHGEPSGIDASQEGAAQATYASGAATQVATAVKRQSKWKRAFRTQQPNARSRIVFKGSRQKLVSKHKIQFVTRRTKRLRPVGSDKSRRSTSITRTFRRKNGFGPDGFLSSIFEPLNGRSAFLSV